MPNGLNLPGRGFQDPRRAYAQSLMASGSSGQPIRHWMQGVGNLAQQLIGAYLHSQSTQEEQAAQEAMTRGFTTPGEGGVPGGYAGGVAALRGMTGNPYARSLAGRLAMGQAQQQREHASLTGERGWKEQQAEKQRGFERGQLETEWAARERIEKLRAQAKPPKLVQVLDPVTGKGRWVPSREAVGMPTAPSQFADLKEALIRQQTQTQQVKTENLQREAVTREREAEMARHQKISNLEESSASLKNLHDSVVGLIAHPGLTGATGIAGGFWTAPGSQTFDFEKKLEQITSAQFLENVQKMKGLGALSEMEAKIVKDSVAVLTPGVRKDTMLAELEKVSQIINRAAQRNIEEIKLIKSWGGDQQRAGTGVGPGGVGVGRRTSGAAGPSQADEDLLNLYGGG